MSGGEKATSEDIEVAIAWLEVNEGIDDADKGGRTEMQSCQAVIGLLRGILESRAREATIRQLVKDTGRSAKDVRALMKAKSL